MSPSSGSEQAEKEEEGEEEEEKKEEDQFLDELQPSGMVTGSDLPFYPSNCTHVYMLHGCTSGTAGFG